MYFQPVTGVGGYSGWLILQRTEARQRESFEKSPVLVRDIEYFRENISKALTAKELVDDRRLRAVALGAFGLGEEIDKKAFIQKILEGGTQDDDALANRLTDPRYVALSEAFGYGDESGGVNVLLNSFQEDIVARFKSIEFERALGENDNDMRLAMNFRREISDYASSESEPRTIWLRIMGQEPLRQVVGKALNIPDTVGQLDVDRQQEIFADKAEQLFGSSDPSIFTDPEIVTDTLRRFFLTRQVEDGPSAQTPGYSALSLLQGSSLGGSTIENLLLSRA